MRVADCVVDGDFDCSSLVPASLQSLNFPSAWLLEYRMEDWVSASKSELNTAAFPRMRKIETPPHSVASASSFLAWALPRSCPGPAPHAPSLQRPSHSPTFFCAPYLPGWYHLQKPQTTHFPSILTYTGTEYSFRLFWNAVPLPTLKCRPHQPFLPTCPSSCAAWRRRCVSFSRSLPGRVSMRDPRSSVLSSVLSIDSFANLVLSGCLLDS